MVETGSENECDWAERDGREMGGDSNVGGCWESAAAEACKRGLRRTATGRGVVTEDAGALQGERESEVQRRQVGVSGNGGSGAGMRSGVVGGKT